MWGGCLSGKGRYSAQRKNLPKIFGKFKKIGVGTRLISQSCWSGPCHSPHITQASIHIRIHGATHTPDIVSDGVCVAVHETSVEEHVSYEVGAGCISCGGPIALWLGRLDVGKGMAHRKRWTWSDGGIDQAHQFGDRRQSPTFSAPDVFV